ncbi:hypothetical protein [Microcoleus sp. Pol17_C1]|uniref:hypothetical protein n=1 Tax=unclassified Microcoleus TaxID=2642155 RepID=UPI002FD4D632
MTRFLSLAIGFTYRQTLYHIIVGWIGQGKSRREIFFEVVVQWQLPSSSIEH